MMNENCIDYCMCADCVYNENYCVNTPKPCAGCFCDVCEDCDMVVDLFCNKHLTIEKVNAIIEEKKER